MTGEMVCWVKGLEYKCRGLSLDSQNPYKKSCMLQRESVVTAFLVRCHAKIKMPRGSQAASLLYAAAVNNRRLGFK